MSWLTNIVSSGIDEVVDSVGKAADNLFTSDEEKLILKNKLEQIRLDAKLKQIEMAQGQEKEITKRWLSDNEHVITRLVRPISYITMLVLYILMIGFDGNVGDFKVNSVYIPMLETLLVTMTIAYFGGRTLEKYKRISNEKD